MRPNAPMRLAATSIMTVLLSLPLTSCFGGDDGGVRVKMVISGMQTLLDSASAKHALATAAAVSAPTSLYYDGIGQTIGDTVVDGLKITIERITARRGLGCGGDNEVIAANWENAPRELEIARGFNGAVSHDALLPEGTYLGMGVNVGPAYSIKAWAFLDTDNDTTADTTIWTTAAGIEQMSGVIQDTSELTSYDYYDYPFIFAWTADDPVHNTRGDGIDTVFPGPVEIAGGDVIVENEDGTTTVFSEHRIDVIVDTFRMPKVWSGAAGSREWPFQANSDFGISDNAFFPEGEPNFGLNNYLPLSALIDEPNAFAETYAIASTTDFGSGQFQLFTLLVGSDGEPMFARNRGEPSPYLSQHFVLFDKQADGTYQFDVGEKIMCTRDRALAYHTVTGFRRLGFTDAAIPVDITDGPQCDFAGDDCRGDRTAWVKRVQRDDE